MHVKSMAMVRRIGLLMVLAGTMFVAGCDEQQPTATGNPPVAPLAADTSTPPTGGKWDAFTLLLIDVQQFFYADAEANGFADYPQRITRLLAFCRENGIEVIHLRVRFSRDMSDWPTFFKLRGSIPCLEGSEDEKVAPYAREAPGEMVIYKHSYDGFYDTPLADYLEANGKKHLLLAGLTTEVCVLSTTFSAFNRGYLLTLIEDCTAAPINAHRFVTTWYDGHLFEVIRQDQIDERYPAWIARLEQLQAIENGPPR
jgi:nicotinamidase-related amidase